MKSRLLVLLLIAVVVTLTSGRGLQADSSEIWNTGNVTTISHNSFPQIKGNCLVWQGRGGLGGATSGSGDWEVFLYDIDNQVGIQVTDDDFDDISPHTDGEYIVWQKHDTSSSNQIFLYEIHGENPPGGSMISNDDNKDNYSPRIAAGLVVWTSQRVAHSFEPGEIMLYDARNLTGPYSISDNTLDCCSPRINSESIIWVQSEGNGATTLFMYDLTSENPEPEPAPEGYVWPDSPQTDGGLTVLTRHDGSDREIFVYNSSLKTYEQITDNDLEDRDPHISGNNITWVGGEGQASEIFLNSDVEPIDPGSPGTRSSDDGLCFIATAAFGSPMETHVTILRKFRDTYLLPSALGRIFVSAYNRYSPPLAQFIAKHEIVKVAVRISLLPVVAVSYVVLHFGRAVTLGIIMVFLILPILLVLSY
jgi:hypothetical protein